MSLEVILRIVAGGLIPSFAIIIFNTLNHVFDHLGQTPMPPLPESAYDISVGCAFTIFGLCVSAKDHRKANTIIVMFVLLLLSIMLVEMIMPTFEFISKMHGIEITNFVAFWVLCYAIAKVE
jgi:hypothetical protein